MGKHGVVRWCEPFLEIALGNAGRHFSSHDSAMQAIEGTPLRRVLGRHVKAEMWSEDKIFSPRIGREVRFDADEFPRV